MADFTPVALGVKPPQGMSLSDMLNMANVAQQYQQAQQINPLAVRKATAEASTAETGAEKSKFDLNRSYAEKARGVFGGFTNDPDFLTGNSEQMIKKLQASEAFLKSMGVPSHPDGTTAQMIELAKTNPKAVRQQLVNMTQGEMSAESKLTAQFPAATMVNTGNQQIPVQMGNQMLTGVKPGTPQNLGIASSISPISRETLETDPLTNNKVVVSRNDAGNIIGSRAAPAAPAGGGFNALPVGETKETADAAKAIQLQAQKAAGNVQQSQFNNNTIIGLADKALVGSNAETLAKLGGGYAVLNALDTGSATAVDNRQKLGHQLALETANLAASAGLNTDAARALGERMSGDITWTPEAIKSTARMNRALTTGTDMFARGVNAAVERAGNSPFAARDFQNKWSTQEKLVPTLQFADALRNAEADPAGAKAMIDLYGGYGSKEYKEMLQRAGRLNDLITKGK